jgi:hypothetical protein
MFATLTVAACHCGAGCLLGDIVGEWLVYGTDAKINGQSLWVEYLVGTLLHVYRWSIPRCFPWAVGLTSVYVHRLRLCPSFRDRIPVFFYCPHVKRLRAGNNMAGIESRLSILDRVPGRVVWLDGDIPDCNMGL